MMYYYKSIMMEMEAIAKQNEINELKARLAELEAEN